MKKQAAVIVKPFEGRDGILNSIELNKHLADGWLVFTAVPSSNGNILVILEKTENENKNF